MQGQDTSAPAGILETIAGIGFVIAMIVVVL